jgi:hypothetical protein
VRLVLAILLAFAGTAFADECPSQDTLATIARPPGAKRDDAITVLGCVAARFPTAGWAVLVQVTPPDLSDDPSDDHPHGVTVSMILVTVKGKRVAAGAPEKYGAWAIDATSFGTLLAADLDGDGSDEIFVPETTNVDGSTQDDLYVYRRAGKRVKRLGIVTTALEDHAIYEDDDKSTVCTTTTSFVAAGRRRHHLVVDGTVTAGPDADPAHREDCIVGRREYRVGNRQRLTY